MAPGIPASEYVHQQSVKSITGSHYTLFVAMLHLLHSITNVQISLLESSHYGKWGKSPKEAIADNHSCTESEVAIMLHL